MSSCRYWNNHYVSKFDIEDNYLENSYSSIIKEDAGKFSLKASRKIVRDLSALFLKKNLKQNVNKFSNRDFTYKIINHEQKT